MINSDKLIPQLLFEQLRSMKTRDCMSLHSRFSPETYTPQCRQLKEELYFQVCWKLHEYLGEEFNSEPTLYESLNWWID